MRENKTITTQDICGKPKTGKKPQAVRTTEKIPLYDKLLQPYTLGFSLTPNPNSTHKILNKNPTISPRSPLNITHVSLTRSTDIPLDPSSDIPLGLPGSHSHSLMFTWCSFCSTALNINIRTIYTSYREFKIKGNPTPKRTRLTCST